MLIFVVFVATVSGMEAFAYAMHRWVMHGPGWFRHASHHCARTGPFEWNNLYAVIFALPSIALIWLGVKGGWAPLATAVGARIAVYGAIYFGFHDWIVHQRLPHRSVPCLPSLRRIVQAHRLHHSVTSRRGAVSFGFLMAPRPEALKAALRSSQKAQMRTPTQRGFS